MTDKEDEKNGVDIPTDSGHQPHESSGSHLGDVINVVRPIGPESTQGTRQEIDVSQSGHWIRDRETGEVCANPLDIDDQTKRDNVNVMQRTTTTWAAHVGFISILYSILLGQLLFTPPKVIVVPVEVWGVIVGIYAGTSTNVIAKFLELKDRIKRQDK